jgi:hypothetical protein
VIYSVSLLPSGGQQGFSIVCKFLNLCKIKGQWEETMHNGKVNHPIHLIKENTDSLQTPLSLIENRI